MSIDLMALKSCRLAPSGGSSSVLGMLHAERAWGLQCDILKPDNTTRRMRTGVWTQDLLLPPWTLWTYDTLTFGGLVKLKQWWYEKRQWVRGDPCTDLMPPTNLRPGANVWSRLWEVEVEMRATLDKGKGWSCIWRKLV